jgi:RhtB (resistance to homoserine/threonine) family protein
MIQHVSDYLAYLENIITIASIYIIAVISPGPDFAMIVRNSLVFSKRSGLMAALGITTGILMHATYTLFGLGLLIRNSPWLFKTIQVAGAAYLIYIGWQSLQAKAQPSQEFDIAKPECARDLTPFHAFKTGFLSNALNPMVIVLFISIFSTVINPATPVPIKVVYVLEMVLITFSWFSTVAIFFSAHHIRKQFLKLGHWLERLAGGVLISLGLRIFFLLGR